MFDVKLVSVNDTINWYEGFRAHYGNTTAVNIARLFIVPGMSHSRGCEYGGTVLMVP
jgi:hypothetical protein